MGNIFKGKNRTRNSKLRNAFLGAALLVSTAIGGCKKDTQVTYFCSNYFFVLNRGRSLADKKITYEGLTVGNRGIYAIVSVLDKNNKPSKPLNILEGSSVRIPGYLISVPSLDDGIFNSKRIKVKVFPSFNKPCSL